MSRYPGGWFRLWSSGPGLSWTSAPPLFSERYGYRKPILRLGRWRVFVLSRARLSDGGQP